MRGREEHEIKSNQKMEALIVSYPPYMRDFYAYMEEKSYTTRKTYIQYVFHMLKFITGTDNVPLETLAAITTVDLQTYMSSLKYKDLGNGDVRKLDPSIRATRWSALNFFYRFLVQRKYIESNPFSDYIQRPKLKEQKDVVYLTSDEIQQLLEHISATASPVFRNRDLAIVTLAISTGLRETAVTEINISDINFANGSIFTTNKGEKSWHVYPAKMSMGYIQAWIEDRKSLFREGDEHTDALFISQYRKRVTAQCLINMIKKYTVIFDKHITFHKLRSTCATNLYKVSNDLYLVAETLGHSNVSVTKRYTKLSDERRREAGSLMDGILEQEAEGDFSG